MIVGDDDLPVSALGSGQDPLDTARGQRQRSLAEHVQLRRQRGQHVRLVQVVRRRDHHRVQLVALQQLLDVGEDVGNVEAVGERTRFRPIVVAERDEAHALGTGDGGKVRELRDRPRADHRKPNLAHCAPPPAVRPGAVSK